MLIWRGNGLAVPILAFGPLLAMDFITSKQSGPGYYASHVWPKLLGFTIAAVAVFFLARFTENSGREGDHFFFIPIKIWTYILLVGGVVLSFALTEAAPAAPPPVKETPPAAAIPAPEAAPSNPSSASYAPPNQFPAPAVTTVAAQPPPEPIRQFAQVYADSNSKTYFPEPCRARPSNAVRLAKSAALLQGYVLSPKCTE
jgi:hypothetical protein